MASERVGQGRAGDAPPTDEREMLRQLDALLEDAGINVATEIRDGVLYLAGQVDSAESRQAALDLATGLVGQRGLRVEEDLDVLEVAPDTGFLGDDEAGGGPFGYLDPDVDHDDQLDPPYEIEPDFAGSIGTTDSEESTAEATPYFPPTDPVVRPSSDPEALEVVGGFGATSMDDTAGEAGFDERNDDDITQEVLRELAEDASTADLSIRVYTRNGVVVLRGIVPSLEDAESAEAVASRVGGVREVREEMTVEGLARE